MKIAFYASEKPREQALADNFLAGVQLHGHEAFIQPLEPEPRIVDCDAACMVGVKSARLFQAVKAAGQVPIYLDKGYIRSRRQQSRTWEYWRVSVGAHHPTSTTLMAARMPPDRLEALDLAPRPWRRRGLQVVFAGSSAKYHEFYGLPDPTTYAEGIVADLLRLTDRPIIYRAKPSWRDARPIKGTRFSEPGEGIGGAILNAHCLITHGSNACFEAALAGVPSIILGDAVARPISSTSLDELEDPICGKRDRWLASLAYHQFTEEEMRAGTAWATIGGWVDGFRT